MKLTAKNQNGFTLVELLIALVIFAVGILGVGAMQITSIKGNSKGRLISEASNVAADRIEVFMSLDFCDPLLADFDDDGSDGFDYCLSDGVSNILDQDSNNDGVDDDNSAGSIIDDNFGLDDVVCCNNGNDPDGNAVSGCTDDEVKSDGCASTNGYHVYWNVAVGYPETNTKTINVFVYPPGNNTGFVEMSFVKSLASDSFY